MVILHMSSRTCHYTIKGNFRNSAGYLLYSRNLINSLPTCGMLGSYETYEYQIVMNTFSCYYVYVLHSAMTHMHDIVLHII